MHKYVQQCFRSQVNKVEIVKASGLLKPLQILGYNWQSISMDFITGLPKTQREKDAILVIVDHLSEMNTKTVETPQLVD